MLLLTGPPGSGRTSYVLAELREALRRKDPGVCLLTPTATMADHLRHKLAREGFVLRPDSIRTLSKFVAPWTEDLPEISQPGLYLLVDRVARRLAFPEFAPVLGTPGFGAALAEAIGEFSSAGCGSAQLARFLPHTQFGPAFLAVYEQVERELARCGLGLRSSRLKCAAQRIAGQGLGNLHTVWMDGFFALTDPELEVVRAIGTHAKLIVTLPLRAGPDATRDALLAMGFAERRLGRLRAEPAVEVFSAPTVDREAAEIARRIAERGEFGQTGIIVRNPDVYLPALRAALERFGVPARFYFSQLLSEHGLVKFLSGILTSLLSGWDHAATLAALRLSGESAELDRFDFDVRERLPGRGLDGLRRLAGDHRLTAMIGHFAALEDWRPVASTPQQWASRVGSLRTLVQPGQPSDGQTAETTMQWRSQSSALVAWEAAMEEAAKSFEAGALISLAEFWDAAQTVLRLTPLRVQDQRRNVVHVLSVYEARQWELPRVFVCGLAEQQFPKRQSQDPLFPDIVRVKLEQAGIRVRTAAELEGEEKFLFELARTRATAALTLSYAEADSRGARNMPSQFLDRAPERCLEIARPEPWWPGALRAASQSIQAPAVLRFSPSALECFLDCPFQYFARHTLRLSTRPLLPQERLDFMLQGTIVHQTLAEWHRTPQPIEPLFDRIFAEYCGKKAVFMGYRTEYLRRQMLDDLRFFSEKQKLPVSGEVLTEHEFTMQVDDSLLVRGRIDRIDKLPDGEALIVDYKYSGAANVAAKLEKPTLLQGGLYALAVERELGLKPVGVFYYGLKSDTKRETKVVGWSNPPGAFRIQSEALTREWMERAVDQARTAAEQIRQGRIAPSPQSLELCRFCNFCDVCRYDGAARTLTAG